MATVPGTTVLVVDDDVVLASAIKRAVEGEGHAVVLAHSAVEARTRMRQWGERTFAVVILDQFLGDGLGTDLLAEFSALTPQPAIGLFSGSFDFPLARDAYEAGAIAFPRPVDPTTLKEVIEYLAVRGAPRSTLVPADSQWNLRSGHTFGRFCLKKTSFVTPRGVLELRRASAAVLAYLIGRRTEWASTDEIALEVFGRKPELQGGRGLVYQHVYALKAELGELGWIVDSRRNVGYRLAPAALLASTGPDDGAEVSRQSGEARTFERGVGGASKRRRAG